MKKLLTAAAIAVIIATGCNQEYRPKYIVTLYSAEGKFINSWISICTPSTVNSGWIFHDETGSVVRISGTVTITRIK